MPLTVVGPFTLPVSLEIFKNLLRLSKNIYKHINFISNNTHSFFGNIL